MAAVVSNTSDTTTAADKAAALTFLKINYNWPKSIQFGTGEDAASYNLSFVMNNSTGTIVMNVLKPLGQYTNDHCGFAYLDATQMVQMSDGERTSLVAEAAEATIKDHIASKKKFIQSKMAAIQAGDVVEVNGVKHTVMSAKNQELEVKAANQQQAGKGALAGLLGALGAIGSGMGGFAGLGLGKEAVEAQKLIQDLQNQQAELAKKTINPPKTGSTDFACPKCGKKWKGAAPQKCSCGSLVISVESPEIQATLNKFYDNQFIKNLKANTKMSSFQQKYQNQYAEEQDDDFDKEYMDDDKEELIPPISMPSIPLSVKDAMKKPVTDDGFKDTSNDEQKFIQRVGMMSNLNVSIQGKKRIGITVYRLFCDKCKTPQDIEAGVIMHRRIEDKVLVEFCNTHRHVAIVPQSEGERKFKDV